MLQPLVKAMQLVGALMLYGSAATALAWYVVLWPFDRAAR
jgi:hypothetical protein